MQVWAGPGCSGTLGRTHPASASSWGLQAFLGSRPHYLNICLHGLMALPLCVSGHISLSKYKHILRSRG